MKNLLELKTALSNGDRLVWKDPDSIPENDYTITWIEEIDEEEFDVDCPILIQYNEGSEAQVYLHEIIKSNQYDKQHLLL